MTSVNSVEVGVDTNASGTIDSGDTLPIGGQLTEVLEVTVK